MGFLLNSRRNAVLALFLSLSASYTGAFSNNGAFIAGYGPVPQHAVSSSRRSPFGIRSSLSMSSNSIVKRDNSSVEITISAPGEATQAAYDRACAEVSKAITVQGFRKGSKIPARVLENELEAKAPGGRYAIRKQAIDSLMQRLVEPALQAEGVEPIGQPTMTIPSEELAKDFVPGESIDMKVLCDVWPELVWDTDKYGDEPWKGLTGTYKRKPFNQEKFDKSMSDLHEKYAELTPIEDASYKLAWGDACVVDMVGYMAADDGVTKGDPLPTAASGDSVDIVLGEGRYMVGLAEGIVGAAVGETVECTVRFPENLKDKTLAGKLSLFDVKVLSTSSRKLPELDDAFAASVRPGMTYEQLKKELENAINDEESGEFVEDRNKALGDCLAERISVGVPDTVVTQQAREKYTMTMTEMRDNGTPDEEIKKIITPENFLKFKAIYREGIEKDFKISMAVDELAQTQNVVPDPTDVEAQMQSVKKEVEDAGETFDDAALRPRVESTIQRKMVFDLMAREANLDVEYVGEEDFDPELLTKLAQESLEREGVDIESATKATDEAKAAAADNSAAEAAETEAKVDNIL